jgi:glycosyltransferase involved in cell wall biosynthesis
MKPLLSICILTYNRPKYLVELLNSVFALNKTYLDQVEIIVIDNGSTDETWKTIQKYDTNTNFISERFPVNLRGSASYLELIKRAKGDFLLFPGDDDVFKSKTLA